MGMCFASLSQMALKGDQCLPEPAKFIFYPDHLSEVRTMRTTPWMGWPPKCEVAAGPVKTKVTFENWTSVPPLMQTCSVDGPLVSKGAELPLPVMLTGPVTTKPGTVVAGLLAGQTLVS